MAVNQRIRQRNLAADQILPADVDVEPIDEEEQRSIVASLEGNQVIFTTENHFQSLY